MSINIKNHTLNGDKKELKKNTLSKISDDMHITTYIGSGPWGTFVFKSICIYIIGIYIEYL